MAWQLVPFCFLDVLLDCEVAQRVRIDCRHNPRRAQMELTCAGGFCQVVQQNIFYRLALLEYEVVELGDVRV